MNEFLLYHGCPSDLCERLQHTAFTAVTSSPAYSTMPLLSNTYSPIPTLRSLLAGPDGQPTLQRLHLLAARHPQAQFTRILSQPRLDATLRTLLPLAAARLRHSAIPPSHLLFTMTRLAQKHALTDLETAPTSTSRESASRSHP